MFAAAGVFFWLQPSKGLQDRIKDSLIVMDSDQTIETTSIYPMFFKRFDQSILPVPEIPKPVAPIIDPAVKLKAWNLVGVVQGDNKSMALFSQGNSLITQRVGDNIAEFKLIEIAPRHALFKQGERTVKLTMVQTLDQRASLTRR